MATQIAGLSGYLTASGLSSLAFANGNNRATARRLRHYLETQAA